MNTNEALKLTPEQEALAQALHQNSRRANGKYLMKLDDARKLTASFANPDQSVAIINVHSITP